MAMSARRVTISFYEQTPRCYHRSWGHYFPGRIRRRALGKCLHWQERHWPHHALGPQRYPVRFGGECAKFDITRYGIDAREAKRLDRFGQFGIAASINAVKDSGLDFATEDPYRCGVVIGSGIGGIETLQEQDKILRERGVSRVSPFTVPRLMVNAASGNVSILFKINGPNTAVATACATGCTRHRRCRTIHPARNG